MNKVNEIDKLIGDSIEIKSLDDLGFQGDIPETSDTIEGNSRLKVDYIVDRFDVNCFADDSGLEVEFLDGAPGVYSARYAGSTATDFQNLELLLKNLEGVENRKARFKTVITLKISDKYHQFTGIINGSITKKPSGDGGFGYDPIFIPNSYDKTFAEMSMDQKNKISHRGKAVRQLIDYLQKLV